MDNAQKTDFDFSDFDFTWLHFQNTAELTTKYILIMITEPFTVNAVIWLVIASLIIHISRIVYEVYLTRPVTKVLRYIKKKFSIKFITNIFKKRIKE